MDEDRLADVALVEREEELRVGSRALNKRVRTLEARVVDLRVGLEAVGDELLPEARCWSILNEIEELEDDIYAARWGLYELTAGALGDNYNAADVALWCERAIEMGAVHPRLDQALLMELVHVRKVPNEPFRTRLACLMDGSDDPERKGRVVRRVHRALSKIEQARGEQHGSASLLANGISQGRMGVPQGRILERWLGMETAGDPPGLRLFVSYEQAEALAIALDLSPHDAGI